MQQPRNIAGPEVRKHRVRKKMTQQMLVAKLNLLGWDISRETLAKVESQVRWVADFELVCLAEALGISALQLLPSHGRHFVRPTCG